MINKYGDSSGGDFTMIIVSMFTNEMKIETDYDGNPKEIMMILILSLATWIKTF